MIAASLAAGLLLVAGAGPLTAQEAAEQEPEPPSLVLGVELEARIGSAGPGSGAPTRVRVRYRLAPATGVGMVPLKGLGFFGARPAAVGVRFGDGPTRSVALQNPRGDLLSATPAIPGVPAAGDTLSLLLTYELEQAISPDARAFDLVLPVIYVDWPPAGAPEDMFAARVTIPADYTVVEAFPTVPKEVTVDGDRRSYTFGVQVVPSMVRFRGHVGEAPLLTFARKVDLAVVLILLVAGGLGWRGLRRHVA